MVRSSDPNTVFRHLNAEEREIRRQYLLEFPEDELRLPPFTTGHADEISAWWDAKQAAAGTADPDTAGATEPVADKPVGHLG
jgi:hypothetical protein